tara:strand:+ start:9145 stop:9579 length:435 start_codon:yes stop_codon:yes gene_type:complete
MKFDDEYFLNSHKDDYRELVQFKRNYLRKSKRKLLWARSSIAGFGGDTMQTCARTLVEWDILDSPSSVIDFYEKPWKWEHELCLLVQILDYDDKDQFSDKVTEVIRSCLDNQSDSYYSVIDIVNEAIKDTKESIAYYKEQLEVA